MLLFTCSNCQHSKYPLVSMAHSLWLWSEFHLNPLEPTLQVCKAAQSPCCTIHAAFTLTATCHWDAKLYRYLGLRG